MKNKFIAMLSFVFVGFMLFAPAANAANTLYFNSTADSFENTKSSGYTYHQKRDPRASLFGNIFYFFTKNDDGLTAQPQKPEQEDTITQPKEEVEQPTQPKDEQKPVEPEKEQQPDQPKEEQKPAEPEKEQQPDQPKEEQKPAESEKEQHPESENQTNNIVNVEELKMLEYINNERIKAGVPPLTMDTEVAKVAQIKSQDMVDNNYFSHTSPNYGSPFDMMKSFGISYRAAGENIAINTTMAKAHTALMNSQGHRENILNPNFTHIGIGIVNNGSGITVTQMFIGK